MAYAFNFLPKNSVGDIIDMLMQMLEVGFNSRRLSQRSFIYLKALEFIHDLNIAHRVSTLLCLYFCLRYNNSCDSCRMYSLIILLFSGTQSRYAR